MYLQDIQELVIDNLAHDLDTLISCGRVCKAWVPLARKHLLRDVVVRWPQTWDRFRDVIQPYARRPRVETSDIPEPVPAYVAVKITFLLVGGGFSASSHAMLLPRALNRITNLELNNAFENLMALLLFEFLSHSWKYHD
jgi:hypothetical protein